MAQQDLGYLLREKEKKLLALLSRRQDKECDDLKLSRVVKTSKKQQEEYDGITMLRELDYAKKLDATKKRSPNLKRSSIVTIADSLEENHGRSDLDTNFLLEQSNFDITIKLSERDSTIESLQNELKNKVHSNFPDNISMTLFK
jgi:hypothetical protein